MDRDKEDPKPPEWPWVWQCQDCDYLDRTDWAVTADEAARKPQPDKCPDCGGDDFDLAQTSWKGLHGKPKDD